MEQTCIRVLKTNTESWGDGYNEGARGRITCIPKRTWWHIEHGMNIVQKVHKGPNDKKTVGAITTQAWMHSRLYIGMLLTSLLMDPWLMVHTTFLHQGLC